ncbi:MAG: hypothetical protein JSV09_10910 [Thermoplasmata archaeon]|nr:MAG: hypothetical protein JSV09_10910 [Thermoplasmata archaeon]
MDSKVAFTLILIGAIVGSGMIAYNADNLYLSNRDNVVAALPARMVGGYETSIIASATDSSGEPAAFEDVKVILETENETYELYKGKTDKTGTAQPSFKVPDYKGNAKLVVKVGKEKLSQNVKVLDSESGDFLTKILITTDKPIYQPDQTVHIRTLAYEGVELEASDRHVEIEIQDSEGNKIFRKSFEPNDFGIASLDFKLSDQLPLGTYKINVKVGDKTAEKSILVKKYVLPKFKIDLLDTKTWYTVDEDISGRVSAQYFFGKNVEGNARVKAFVYRGVWDQVGYLYEQLENGEASFSFSPAQYAVGLDLNQGNGLLELNITVTDTGGHSEYESHFITLASEPIQITTLSDTNLVDTQSTYYIIARYPNGVPVDDASVTVKIHDETYQETTDSRGIASVQFMYEGQDSMKIGVAKGHESATKEIYITESFGIKVISDKSLYDMGDVAEFDIFYTGEGSTDLVYYEAISEGFVITTGREKLKDGQASFEIPITPDMAPSTTIRVYKIEKDMDVVRDSLVLLITSPEQLDVNITTDKDIYRPNEDVMLEFYISNVDGPVYSAIGIAGVDMSVFEVSERFSGFEEVFWGLEEEFLTPQYQIISYVFDPMPAPLPVDGEDEIPKGGEENEIGILSSWPKAEDDAKNVKNNWIDNYWGALAVLAILGFFGLFAFAIKYKAAAVVAIFIAMLLLLAIVAVLYAGTTSMISSTDSPGVPFGGDQGKMADEGGIGDGDGIWVDLEEDWDGELFFDNRVPAGMKIVPGSPLAPNGSGYKPTHVRTYFPETWYWNPALITDENGYAFVTLTTPDSITTWGIDAIASTKDAQLGTGNAEVTVFQEFFVEPDIPVSVIRGDEFPLRVLVYNYENVTSSITVELQQDLWFELLSEKIQYVDVEANSVSSVDFVIKANSVGEHDITINASSISLEDKIVKEMRVDPDGKRLDSVANGQLDNNQSVTVDIELDSQRVENSENAYVKLQGGMEAVTLDGAETYIRFVSGCGEQSMSTLSIDILAFDTVQNMEGTDEQLFEFETIVNQGIQHELTFLLPAQNGIGRGIVWFPSDQDVHPWLTSWGLITFQDAKNAGFNLDDAIITDMQDWLTSQQEDDGSYKFPDWGIYETNNPILKAKKVATTAYITRALLYSGYTPTGAAITKSLGYIKDNINEHWDDPYTLAISLIALEDANGDSTLRSDIASRLEDLKEEENSTVYWTSDTNMISDGDDFIGWRYSYNSHTIETTGYAIMALAKHGGHSTTVNKAINYLLGHRSGLGGFFSTQDTVVAFQALASIGEINIEEMTITVEANSEEIDSIVFTEENKDITFLLDLRPYLAETTTVTITSSGVGSVLYQVYSSQYIPWNVIGPNEPSEMSLDVAYSTQNITVNDMIGATLRLEYLGSATKLKMVLVDLRAPVGFSFVESDFSNLVALGKVSNYEINDRELMVYIQDVYPNQPLTFTYPLLAKKPVKSVVAGIHAFDMYNPDLDVELLPIEIVAT